MTTKAYHPRNQVLDRSSKADLEFERVPIKLIQHRNPLGNLNTRIFLQQTRGSWL